MTHHPFPNGKNEHHEPQDAQDADPTFAESIRRVAQTAEPPSEFVHELEARLRSQAASHPYFQRPDLPDSATLKENTRMQMQRTMQRPLSAGRSHRFLTLPIAAAVTALIATGAAILMITLSALPSPNPYGAGEQAPAAMLAASSTPTPAGVEVRVTPTVEPDAPATATALSGGVTTIVSDQMTQAAQRQHQVDLESTSLYATATQIIAQATAQAALAMTDIARANPLPSLDGGTQALIGHLTAEAQTLATRDAIIAQATAAPPQHPTLPLSVGAWVSDFSDSTIRLMTESGITWVVQSIPFRQQAEGDSDPLTAIAKTLISTAHANDFKILLVLYGEPADFAEDFRGYVEAFSNFAGDVAALSPDAIQVWNEPNIDRHWTTNELFSADYVTLLRGAYRAIKAADPDVSVITAAPDPTSVQGQFPGQIVDDDVYYQGMADAGAAHYADCIGVEYNEGTVPPDATSGDPRDDTATRYLVPMLQRAAEPFRESGLPLCVTSFGYASFDRAVMPPGFDVSLSQPFQWADSTTAQDQAAWTAQAVEVMASLSSIRVEMVMLWRIDPVDDFYTGVYALMRAGGDCPTCQALAELARR